MLPPQSNHNSITSPDIHHHTISLLEKVSPTAFELETTASRLNNPSIIYTHPLGVGRGFHLSINFHKVRSTLRAITPQYIGTLFTTENHEFIVPDSTCIYIISYGSTIVVLNPTDPHISRIHLKNPREIPHSLCFEDNSFWHYNLSPDHAPKGHNENLLHTSGLLQSALCVWDMHSWKRTSIVKSYSYSLESLQSGLLRQVINTTGIFTAKIL